MIGSILILDSDTPKDYERIIRTTMEQGTDSSGNIDTQTMWETLSLQTDELMLWETNSEFKNGNYHTLLFRKAGQVLGMLLTGYTKAEAEELATLIIDTNNLNRSSMETINGIYVGNFEEHFLWITKTQGK